jgi:ribosomal protein S27AE
MISDGFGARFESLERKLNKECTRTGARFLANSMNRMVTKCGQQNKWSLSLGDEVQLNVNGGWYWKLGTFVDC